MPARLDRDRSVAADDADRAGAVQVQHAVVHHVREEPVVRVPRDAAGVFDRQRALVEDPAAIAREAGAAGEALPGDRTSPAMV